MTSPAVPATTTLEDLRREIDADVKAGEAAVLAAGAEPADGARREALAQFFGGVLLDRQIARLDEQVAAGSLVRSNPQIPNIAVVEDLDPIAADRVSVVVCRIDASIVYIPATGDQPEAIVDDGVWRFRSEATLELIDGVWRGTAATSIEETLGAREC